MRARSNICSWAVGIHRSPLFEEIRQRVKSESKRDDVIALIAWLLIHFTDEPSPFAASCTTQDDRPRRDDVLARAVPTASKRTPKSRVTGSFSIRSVCR